MSEAVAYRLVGTCGTIRSYSVLPSRRWGLSGQAEFGTVRAESRCGRITRVIRGLGR